jgi:hypothetical protein
MQDWLGPVAGIDVRVFWYCGSFYFIFKGMDYSMIEILHSDVF